jgi:NDP-sugar pyrophosphorylase family protein
MQAVILAGGLATRMRPLTRTLPKSLLRVAGRPFIAWQLRKIAASGFSRVLLCVGHLGDRIRDFVEDGRDFGLQVEYSDDGPELLGTAGALRKGLELLEPTFLVTYGDSYLPFDYSAPLRDLVAHPEANGTMSVFHNSGKWDASNTAIAGDRVVRYEKGSTDPALDHIDYGATALRREVVAALPPGQTHGLDEVQSRLVRHGQLRALLAHERFFEIGSAEGLAALEEKLGGHP